MSELFILQVTLLPVGLIVSLLRFHEVSRVRSITGIAWLVGSISYIGFSILVWGGLGFLLKGVISWMANLGVLGQLWLALLAFAAGRFGLGEISLGLGMMFGLLRPDPLALFWSVTPNSLGYILGYISRDSISYEQRLTQMISYGSYIIPPALSDILLRFFHFFLGGLPLVIGTIMAVKLQDPVLGLLRLMGCIVVSSHVWLVAWDANSTIRFLRRGQRLAEIVSIFLALLLAASPLGSNIVVAWVRFPLIGDYGWAGLVVVLLLTKIIVNHFISKSDSGIAIKSLVRALVVFNHLFLNKGMFLIFSACIYNANISFLVAAILIAGLDLISTIAKRPNMATVFHGQALSYLNKLLLQEDQQTYFWGPWLYDAFLAHPSHPDTSLINKLLDEAITVAHGHGSTDIVQYIWTGNPTQPTRPTARDALNFIVLADEAVALVESELTPRWPKKYLAVLSERLLEVQARNSLVKAIVYQYINLREEAMAAWNDAATEYENLGLQNTAAQCQIGAAGLLNGLLGQSIEARHMLEPILNNPDLNPVTTRMALTVATMAELQLGNLDAAKHLYERRASMKISHHNFRRMARELSSRRSIQDKSIQVFTALFLQQDSLLDMLFGKDTLDVHELPSPLEFRSRLLALRGLALLISGQETKAQEILEEAARLAEQDGYFTWVFSARYYLALTYLSNDPKRAYREVTNALEAQSQIRNLVLDPNLRTSVVGYYLNAYYLAILLLVDAVQQKDSDWPDRPLAHAYGLVERSRSRVLLEKLGESTILKLPNIDSDLIKVEQEKYTNFLKAQANLGEALNEERLSSMDQLRQKRKDLEEVWDQLGQTHVSGAEYVDIRRGSPIDFDEIARLLIIR